MKIDLDQHIPYEQYYLQHIAKGKKTGDQLTGICPFHEDIKESFGANLQTGKCICRAGCIEGNVISFHAKLKGVSNQDAYADLCKTYNVPQNGSGPKPSSDEKTIPIETLDLFKIIPDSVLPYLQEIRGWSDETIRERGIGYNAKKLFKPGFIDAQRITIPVYDELKNLVNIRSYKPKAGENEQKLMSWSTGSRKKGNWVGHGQARLYPLDVIPAAREQNQIVYIVEGEPDCLCGLSHGLKCVTQTTGAGTWLDEWNPKFKGLHVRLLYDNDEAGIKGMLRIIKHLPSFAKKVECRVWPDFMEDKQDLTDWFMTHRKTVDDLHALEWISPEEFNKRFGEAGTGGEDEDPVEKCVRELNAKHAVIMLSGKCLVMEEGNNPVFNRPDVTFSSPADFKAQYANQKIWIPNGKGINKQVSKGIVWFEHETRRQFSGLIFAPGREVPDYYNLYRGLGVEPQKGDWSLFYGHIKNVIAGGNLDVCKYILAWMADLFQNPGGKRPGVCLVLRGEQGVGKGKFASHIGKIVGNHFLHISQSHQITGKFNDHLKNALFVFVDEGIWAGDKQAEGPLRTMITEDYLHIEPKGKNPFMVENHVRLLIASNNNWVVPAGLDERRFCVLDVSPVHKQDRPYFKALDAQMDSGGREAMLYDLLSFDLSDIDLGAFPRTSALFDQIQRSMKTSEKFWLEKLFESKLLNVHEDWEGKCSTAAIYKEFQEFAQAMGDRFPPMKDVFAKELRQVCPHLKKIREKFGGQNSHREWGIHVGRLQECKQALEKKMGMEIDWPTEEIIEQPNGEYKKC